MHRKEYELVFDNIELSCEIYNNNYLEVEAYTPTEYITNLNQCSEPIEIVKMVEAKYPDVVINNFYTKF
ncbi:MAG: hypothetical protein Q9M36_11355 [Sulfurovum sp.]|nr:hypothetical protein [Sulfurovum sp.]